MKGKKKLQKHETSKENENMKENIIKHLRKLYFP